jgi:vitamin B12 transporter
MQRSLIAGLIACALSSAAAEDIPTFDLGTIVVTPARAPQPLSAALQSTTVIGAPDIAAAGQQTLPELLQMKGGVEIATNGGPGQLSGVFIRGANSSHTVVLVDGVRMDNITSGTTALENIPLDQVERIEIVRGPGSSLYGADAIGGVVQIFTRKPEGSGFQAEAGAGNWNTFKSSVGVWHRVGDTQFDLRAGYEDTHAFSATNSHAPSYVYNPDDDPYRNKNLTASLSHQIDSRNNVGLSAFVAEGSTHIDAGVPGDPVKIEKLQSLSA